MTPATWQDELIDTLRRLINALSAAATCLHPENPVAAEALEAQANEARELLARLAL
jgi:hypothetical protein